MNITYKQKVWLDGRGGWTINDVQGDDKGLYIMMGSGYGKDIKVYLPSDKKIDENNERA